MTLVAVDEDLVGHLRFGQRTSQLHPSLIMQAVQSAVSGQIWPIEGSEDEINLSPFRSYDEWEG